MPVQTSQASASAAHEECLPMVTSLPPLNLRLLFPQDYPSASPPGAAISACWLAPDQAQHLQDHLYEIWDDQGPGLPVCFTWLDWLQSSTMEHLGIHETLFLAPVAAANARNAAMPIMQHPMQHEVLGLQASGAASSSSGPANAATSQQAAFCSAEWSLGSNE